MDTKSTQRIFTSTCPKLFNTSMLFSITKLASRDVVVLDITLTNTLKQTIRLIDHVTHSVQAFSSFSIQALDLQDGCLKRPKPSSESQSRGGS